MSTAVTWMYVALFVIPWMIAGVIYPPASLASRLSRGKIFCIGVAAFVVLLAIAKALSAPIPEEDVPQTELEALMTGLWMLTCMVWPLVALVSLVVRWAIDRARDTNKAAPTQAFKEKPPLPTQKPFKPLSKAQRTAANLPSNSPAVTPDSQAYTAPAAESRAIRTGWQLCRIGFEYEDADGNWTDRQVTVHSVTGAHIKGECHQRRAERTFRLDRILSDITDLDTGEITDIDVWLARYQ